MLKQTAVDYFERPSVVAIKLGVSRQLFHKWGNVLPYWAAEKLEGITNGSIKLDKKLYKQEMVPK
jgi:hypothetical protein